MKRNSIAAIIRKVQFITFRSQFYPSRHIRLVRKAAVNEINRLEAGETLPKIDMKKESDKFLAAIKTICEDYERRTS